MEESIQPCLARGGEEEAVAMQTRQKDQGIMLAHLLAAGMYGMKSIEWSLASRITFLQLAVLLAFPGSCAATHWMETITPELPNGPVACPVCEPKR